jgi:hypothetical protein
VYEDVYSIYGKYGGEGISAKIMLGKNYEKGEEKRQENVKKEDIQKMKRK